MFKTKQKKEKGITLVALIITIIVLIILVAVTIFAFTESGLLKTASKGTENYANAQEYEQKIMDNIDKHAEDIARNIASIAEENGGAGGTGESMDKPEQVPIEILDVGKYVDYKPNSGKYEQEILDIYSGVTTNEAFTTESTLKWKIWDVDETNLYLISETPTTQKLTLRGALGYNNGVTLLDNICKTCYSANYIDIGVANLKIEDLENKMIIPTNSAYSKQPCAGFTGYAPYIWRQNESDDWEAAKNNRSISYDLTTETHSSAYMRPWFNSYTNSILPNGGYNDMLKGEKFWLSSRYACPWKSNYCVFGLQMISDGYLWGWGESGDGYLTYHNKDWEATRKACVRPFITIPLTSFTGSWNDTHENLSIKPI